MPARILEVKVTLREVAPQIWRRIRVPADISLARLHEILQIAMGWKNQHLHEFETEVARFGMPNDYGHEVADERTVHLDEFFKAPGDRFGYWYDFGDDWWHDVVLEREVAPDPGVKYPQVVAGERACPPENSGGPHGYSGFLEALRDPRHSRHAELVDWIGGSFDSEKFDVHGRNVALQRIAKKSSGIRSRSAPEPKARAERKSRESSRPATPRAQSRVEMLRGFLESPTRPPGTLSVEELRGFFFAIASAPALVSPSEWLPNIFGGGEPGFENLAEAQSVIDALMETYNEMVKATDTRASIGPRSVGIDRQVGTSLEAWARGFNRGYQGVEKAWEIARETMEAELEREVMRAIVLFKLAADPKRIIQRAETGEFALPEVRAYFEELLPGALTCLARTGVAAYRENLTKASKASKPEPAPQRPGRNDACPCGSGRKHKQCCMLN